MLTSAQESSLTSAGDCFDHWHSSDRILDHTSVLSLQGISQVFKVTDDFTVTLNQDIIAVDTTLKDITITLPLTGNGRDIEIIKVASPFKLYVQLSGTDLIYGETLVEMDVLGTSLRFKAILGGWVLI